MCAQSQEKEARVESKTFGLAPIKQEGMSCPVDKRQAGDPTPPLLKSTYVERRVPQWLESNAHLVIDELLRKHGINPETY